MNSRYDKLRLLGSGNFGKAWLVASKKSRRHYVIKEMQLPSDAGERDKTFNEVSIIKSCCHVNVIRYKEFFVAHEVLSIVMEFADDGDLQQCIAQRRVTNTSLFPEPLVRNWLVQISLALQYLHKNSILHRDLKTQNIFKTKSGLLKLGDFGISRTLSSENDFATTGVGTPQYLSPEICRMEKYDYKSDVWCLGCVLYEMCALGPAFPGNDFPRLFQNILKANYMPLPPHHFSQDLRELVKVMLRSNPSKRPSTAQIVAAKVLKKDVERYMSQIRSLPDVSKQDDGSLDDVAEELAALRKGSTSSMESSNDSQSNP